MYVCLCVCAYMNIYIWVSLKPKEDLRSPTFGATFGTEPGFSRRSVSAFNSWTISLDPFYIFFPPFLQDSSEEWLKYPLTYNWVIKHGIYKMECSPVRESSGVFIHSIIWINLKNIMISERHWAWRTILHDPTAVRTGDCRAGKMAQ